jgi:divalent metal cation (Fe/Co/Zn/Cd) transporter
LFAALGIFVGGSGLAFDETIQSALHPSSVHSYLIGYVVLAMTLALDTFALKIAARPLRQQAAERGLSLRRYLPRGTDRASTTVVVGGASSVVGAVTAAAGLGFSELTTSPTPDTVASGLIGLLLITASVLLLRTHRELLSGRGVPPSMLLEMRHIIAAQPGVVDIPDLFAVVVGPSSLIVNSDVTFADDLDVPAVEQTIVRSRTALRAQWSSIDYVHLTPVSRARARRWPWRPRTRVGQDK